jgi:hypothetical protein
MFWILAMLMAGLGLGYVSIRRKRKAQQNPIKRAA